MIYPGPFGSITAGADNNYPLDYSHLSIQGYACGANGLPKGFKPGPDTATFPSVNTETEYGWTKKIRMKVPIFTGALGSTELARKNWDHFAIGTAISGITLVCGEKVCGIDPQLVLDKDGKVKSSPEMDRRIETSRRYHEGFGEILVQMNVEDTRFGVAEYVLNEYGLDAIELKWGQGRAQELKRRGYIVTPDPTHDRGRDHRPDQGHPDCSAERGDERRPDDYDRVRDRRQARGRQEDGRRDARRDGRRRQVLNRQTWRRGSTPSLRWIARGSTPND